ncbi:hypothetical protein M8998_16120 [Sphingobacterium sp. lm-10]|uniref:hypothetical protein n=1 Tax=Sphingobacterium sp. lm-10 TaxID=2944904 RepID=UPI0020204B52|nr:hypothetical protein [Sphingobacterium sp. lm-10]MCL7989478.1 hypothetical protein [Sphingobacterium sp. lm-10]
MKFFYSLLSVLILTVACSKNTLELPVEVEESPEPEQKEIEYFPFALRVDNIEVDIFQAVTFKLIDSVAKDEGNFFSFLKYKVLDSLIWNVEGATNKVHLVEHDESGFGVKTEWGHNFYAPGEYKTYLKGYREGNQVVNDSILVLVNTPKDKDFLQFSWSEIVAPLTAHIGYVNNNTEEYHFSTVSGLRDGIKSISLNLFYDKYNGEAYKSAPADLPEQARTVLVNYITSMYGPEKYSSESVDVLSIYKALFLTPLLDKEVVKIWSTPTANIALVKGLIEYGRPARYSVLAEPIYK